jgi:large subunit ribosomal protein L12
LSGMEYVYAALLLHRLGKEITEQNIASVVKAAGGEVDEVRVKALVAALQGVNIDEILKTATTAPVTVTAAPAPTQAPAAAPEQQAKEVKEEKPKEEEALAGLSALFG